MKSIILFLCCTTIFVACSTPTPKTPENPGKAEVRTTTTVAPAQKVIYKACTMYAGSTDFLFVDEKGAELNVRMSNMPEDSMKFPDIMFEKGTEGPPDANPAMVGKPFFLIRDADSIVREIKLAN